MAFDYPSSPSIGQVANGYVWDGEKWDSAGSVPGPAVARVDALGWSGMQINGSMEVSQERGTTALALTTGSGYKLIDEWNVYYVNGMAAMTAGQTSISNIGGFTKCIFLQGNTGAAFSGANDLALIYAPIDRRVVQILHRVRRAGRGGRPRRPVGVIEQGADVDVAGLYGRFAVQPDGAGSGTGSDGRPPIVRPYRRATRQDAGAGSAASPCGRIGVPAGGELMGLLQ